MLISPFNMLTACGSHPDHSHEETVNSAIRSSSDWLRQRSIVGAPNGSNMLETHDPQSDSILHKSIGPGDEA